jgi:hypothetical protein
MPFIVAHPLHLFLASVKRLTHLSRFPLLKFEISEVGFRARRQTWHRIALHLGSRGSLRWR